MDGNSTYSDIVNIGVNDENESPKPHLYNTSLDLSEFDVTAPMTISIFDGMGRSLYTLNTLDVKW